MINLICFIHFVESKKKFGILLYIHVSRFNFSFSIYLNIFLNTSIADAHLNILSMLYKIISFSKAILKMYDVLYVCQSCKLRKFSSVEWVLVWHRLGTDPVCSYNYHLGKVIQILPTNEGVRGIWKVLVYRQVLLTITSRLYILHQVVF